MTSASDLASDLKGLNAAIAAAGPLKGASTATLAPVLAAAEKLAADIKTTVDILDGQVASGMAAGGDPATLAAYLTAQTKTVTSESLMVTAQSYASRMVINLAWGGGS